MVTLQARRAQSIHDTTVEYKGTPHTLPHCESYSGYWSNIRDTELSIVVACIYLGQGARDANVKTRRLGKGHDVWALCFPVYYAYVVIYRERCTRLGPSDGQRTGDEYLIPFAEEDIPSEQVDHHKEHLQLPRQILKVRIGL